jgi:hypothetical protein
MTLDGSIMKLPVLSVRLAQGLLWRAEHFFMRSAFMHAIQIITFTGDVKPENVL